MPIFIRPVSFLDRLWGDKADLDDTRDACKHQRGSKRRVYLYGNLVGQKMVAINDQ
jgi:hypothetical protein